MIRAILAVTIGLVVAALVATASAWERATDRKVAQLHENAAAAPPIAEDAIERLPAPVARYLRSALGAERRRIVRVTASQQAEFLVNDAWRPLTATEHFTTSPPGFVWDARIAISPLMPAYVRDVYVSGSGSMEASLLRAYSLVDQSEKAELDSGALQRYLAEAVWFPTLLAPGVGVEWAAVDDRSAEATLRDGQTTVSLRFVFDGQDRVAEVSGNRFAESSGAYTLRPWRVRCDEHERRSGLLIPLFCEVAWMGEKGAEPYWRGRITSIEYVY